MCSTMWFMSVVAVLMVDVRTGALQENDIKMIECHSCSPQNRTSCTVPRTVSCPGRCASTVVVPGLLSSLSCAEAASTPCSLSRANNSLQLTCVCNTPLCNVPFSPELHSQLQKYLPPANTTDIIEHFLQTSTFANISEANIYKAITIEVVSTTTITANKSTPQPVTVLPVTTKSQVLPKESEKPRAEALKQEPTVPSDDDEDEGEGSGSYEDSRVQNHAASAPAAPSSFLPEQNSASLLFKPILLPLSFIYFVV